MSITPNDPANFTPTMLGYTGQGSFRFWCQTVLPLVYDDSLSYYELLNKVVNYLNNTIKDVSNLESNVDNLYNSYVELQSYVNNYFSGLDVQTEIDNKLDEMAESGELMQMFGWFIGYVTPEMYGAIGNGLSDDSEAVQDAINIGGIVICNGTYLVKDISISRNVTILGGSFIDNGSSSFMFSTDNNDDEIKDVIINGAVFDGNNSANGISLNHCHNSCVSNCEIKNMKGGTNNSYGLHLNRCRNVTVEGVSVHNISNDNSQPTRGIYSNRSFRTLIRNCIIYGIISDNDGDGIQIIFDGSQDETEDGCIISACKLYDCSKRYIKIQQKNCIIEKCHILEDDSTFSASDASIAIYDNNCTIRDNYINGKSHYQIMLVGSALEENEFKNTKINGNILKSESASVYGALIGNPDTVTKPFHNLIITDNIFLSNDYQKSGIVIRNLSGTNLIVSNNIFDNVSYGVRFRADTNKTGEISHSSITGNTFKDIYGTPVLVDSGYTMDYLTVLANAYNVINGVSGEINIIIIRDASYDNSKITIQNNIGNGLDGWRRVGAYSIIPTKVPNGFVYFNRGTHSPLTYYEGTWYNPDGTAYGS